jgi:DNA-binding MarR family transcriptional regulator
LIAAGLIEAVPNPDHKRAVLLRATEAGTVLKREFDARAEVIAAAQCADVDQDTIRAATAALREIRKQLEAQLRKR